MFTIQCGSCRAKLKVSKGELIGQSLACPRCGTMVLVEPPSGWVPPLDTNAGREKSLSDPAKQPVAKRRRDQPAPGTKTPEDVQETLPNVGSLGWGEELKLADPESAVLNTTTAAIESSGRPTSAPGRSNAGREATATKEKALPDSLLRPEQWDSIRTRKRRSVLLGVMAALGSLLLFGALGYYWWEQRTRLAELEKSAVKLPPADEETKKDGAPDGAAGQSDQEANANPPKSEKVGPVADVSKAPDGQGLPTLPDSEVNEPDKEANVGRDVVPSPVVPTDNGEPVSPPSEPLPGIGGGSAPESEGDFQGVMEKIFESEALTSEWDDPRLRAWQQGAVDPIDDVLKELAQKTTSRFRSARFVKPLPRTIDPELGLTKKLAGFRHEAGRVPQLMSLAEALSGLPVWLDVERYEGQPISLDETRLVESVQATIPELLLKQLEPFGFSVEQYAWNADRPDVFGLRVFPRDADKMTAAAYTIDWLAADLPPEAQQAELQKFGNFLSQFLVQGQWGDMVVDADTNPEAQRATKLGAWQIRDGKVLVVHYPHVHKRIVRLMRQLSLAKSQQGQPLNWPEDLLPRAVQESGRLQTVINLQNHQPIPLREVFQQIHQQSNVNIVVDWPSLILEGWTPDTVVPVVIENEVVADVVRGLCLDMGLSMRFLAPDTVCLLSDTAEEAYSDVEIYPVADLCPSAREWPVLRGRLLRLLAEDADRYKSAYFHYEPEFRVVVARMPQDSHRKLHVYFRAARRS